MKEKKPINVEVGQYVKQNREEAGLTQEAFAELISLGVKHVSAIECGAVGVSLPTLRKMSEVLSVPADVFLFGTPDKTEQATRTSELQTICVKLSRLSPGKFRIAKEMIDKLLEAFSTQ